MRISDWSSDVCSSDLDSFVVTMTDVTAQIKAAKLLEQSKEELEKRVDERTRELRRLNEILQDEVRRHEQTAADLERARKAAEAANRGQTRFLAPARPAPLPPTRHSVVLGTSVSVRVVLGGRD